MEVVQCCVYFSYFDLVEMFSGNSDFNEKLCECLEQVEVECICVCEVLCGYAVQLSQYNQVLVLLKSFYDIKKELFNDL